MLFENCARHKLGRFFAEAAEPRVVAEWSVEFGGVRVDQEFGGIEPQAPVGIEDPFGPEAIALAFPEAGHAEQMPIALPAEGQAVGLAVARFVEEAQMEEGGIGRVNAEGCAFRVEDGPRLWTGICPAGAQVMTLGVSRPVRDRMSAMLSAAAIRSASASCVSRSCFMQSSS